MKILIVSVIYLEPEWQETKSCIEAAKAYTEANSSHTVDVFYIDRKGIGSLSKAFNDGFKQGNGAEYDYVWFVTNVTFGEGHLFVLLRDIDLSNMFVKLAAIHPSFESDHKHLQTGESYDDLTIPFIEFTAPFIKSEVFAKFPLDEKMPYWGMDLDWSYRVKQAGWQLGCCHAVTLGHTYIRNTVKSIPNKYTRQRYNRRKLTNASTERQLVAKYGVNWRNVLNYK